MEEFEVVGSLRDVETIAVRRSIRDLARLRRTYGRGRWRKRKAFATVKLADGFVCQGGGALVRGNRNRQARTEDQAPIEVIEAWRPEPAGREASWSVSGTRDIRPLWRFGRSTRRCPIAALRRMACCGS